MENKEMPGITDAERITAVVDYIVSTGTEKTSSGNWITSFFDIPWDMADIDFVAENADAIEERLWERDEVLDVAIAESNFDIVYGLQYCPNLEASILDERYDETEEKADALSITSNSDSHSANKTPSVLSRLQEIKQSAVPSERPVPSVPKRNNDMEV